MLSYRIHKDIQETQSTTTGEKINGSHALQCSNGRRRLVRDTQSCDQQLAGTRKEWVRKEHNTCKCEKQRSNANDESEDNRARSNDDHALGTRNSRTQNSELENSELGTRHSELKTAHSLARIEKPEVITLEVIRGSITTTQNSELWKLRTDSS